MGSQGQDLVIANVGDSRAVLGTRDVDNSLIATQLTVDLKPDLPGLSLSLFLSHLLAQADVEKGKMILSVR